MVLSVDANIQMEDFEKDIARVHDLLDRWKPGPSNEADCKSAYPILKEYFLLHMMFEELCHDEKQRLYSEFGATTNAEEDAIDAEVTKALKPLEIQLAAIAKWVDTTGKKILEEERLLKDIMRRHLPLGPSTLIPKHNNAMTETVKTVLDGAGCYMDKSKSSYFEDSETAVGAPAVVTNNANDELEIAIQEQEEELDEILLWPLDIPIPERDFPNAEFELYIKREPPALLEETEGCVVDVIAGGNDPLGYGSDLNIAGGAFSDGGLAPKEGGAQSMDDDEEVDTEYKALEEVYAGPSKMANRSGSAREAREYAQDREAAAEEAARRMKERIDGAENADKPTTNRKKESVGAAVMGAGDEDWKAIKPKGVLFRPKEVEGKGSGKFSEKVESSHESGRGEAGETLSGSLAKPGELRERRAMPRDAAPRDAMSRDADGAEEAPSAIVSEGERVEARGPTQDFEVEASQAEAVRKGLDVEGEEYEEANEDMEAWLATDKEEELERMAMAATEARQRKEVAAARLTEEEREKGEEETEPRPTEEEAAKLAKGEEAKNKAEAMKKAMEKDRSLGAILLAEFTGVDAAHSSPMAVYSTADDGSLADIPQLERIHADAARGRSPAIYPVADNKALDEVPRAEQSSFDVGHCGSPAMTVHRMSATRGVGDSGSGGTAAEAAAGEEPEAPAAMELVGGMVKARASAPGEESWALAALEGSAGGGAEGAPAKGSPEAGVGWRAAGEIPKAAKEGAEEDARGGKTTAIEGDAGADPEHAPEETASAEEAVEAKPEEAPEAIGQSAAGETHPASVTTAPGEKPADARALAVPPLGEIKEGVAEESDQALVKAALPEETPVVRGKRVAPGDVEAAAPLEEEIPKAGGEQAAVEAPGVAGAVQKGVAGEAAEYGGVFSAHNGYPGIYSTAKGAETSSALTETTGKPGPPTVTGHQGKETLSQIGNTYEPGTAEKHEPPGTGYVSAKAKVTNPGGSGRGDEYLGQHVEQFGEAGSGVSPHKIPKESSTANKSHHKVKDGMDNENESTQVMRQIHYGGQTLSQSRSTFAFEADVTGKANDKGEVIYLGKRGGDECIGAHVKRFDETGNESFHFGIITEASTAKERYHIVKQSEEADDGHKDGSSSGKLMTNNDDRDGDNDRLEVNVKAEDLVLPGGCEITSHGTALKHGCQDGLSISKLMARDMSKGWEIKHDGCWSSIMITGIGVLFLLNSRHSRPKSIKKQVSSKPAVKNKLMLDFLRILAIVACILTLAHGSDIDASNSKRFDIAHGNGESHNVPVSSLEAPAIQTFDEDIEQLKRIDSRLRGAAGNSPSEVVSTGILSDVKKVTQGYLSKINHIRGHLHDGNKVEAVKAIKSNINAKALIENNQDGKDKHLASLKSFGIAAENDLPGLDDVPDSQLADFLKPQFFDDVGELAQELVDNLDKIEDLSVLPPRHTDTENNPRGSYGALGSGFDFGQPSFDQRTHDQEKLHPFFSASGFPARLSDHNLFLHQQRAFAGKGFSRVAGLQGGSKFGSFFQSDAAVMAKHQLRVDALGNEVCRPKCTLDDNTCHCERLFQCASDITAYDLALLLWGGYVDSDKSSPTFGNFSLPSLNLFGANADIFNKLNRIKDFVKGNDFGNETVCTSLLEEFFTACDPSKGSCTTATPETFQLSVDNVCDSVMTRIKLLFEVMGDQFDGLDGPDDSSKCSLLSYATCAEFVRAFDRLYEGRDQSSYPQHNPMRKYIAGSLHDKSDSQIFSFATFPIGYAFPQDERGVFDRSFQDFLSPVSCLPVDGLHPILPQNEQGLRFGYDVSALLGVVPNIREIPVTNGRSVHMQQCRDGEHMWDGDVTFFGTSNDEGSYPGRVTIFGNTPPWGHRDFLTLPGQDCQYCTLDPFNLANPTTGMALGLSGNDGCDGLFLDVQKYDKSDPGQQFLLTSDNRIESVRCSQKYLTVPDIPCRVRVDIQPTNDLGAYFKYNEFEWATCLGGLGNVVENPDGETYQVKQCRGDTEVWSGEVFVAVNEGIHIGRKNPALERAPGDWEEGDYVVRPNDQCVGLNLSVCKNGTAVVLRSSDLPYVGQKWRLNADGTITNTACKDFAISPINLKMMDNDFNTTLANKMTGMSMAIEGETCGNGMRIIPQGEASTIPLLRLVKSGGDNNDGSFQLFSPTCPDQNIERNGGGCPDGKTFATWDIGHVPASSSCVRVLPNDAEDSYPAGTFFDFDPSEFQKATGIDPLFPEGYYPNRNYLQQCRDGNSIYEGLFFIRYSTFQGAGFGQRGEVRVTYSTHIDFLDGDTITLPGEDCEACTPGNNKSKWKFNSDGSIESSVCKGKVIGIAESGSSLTLQDSTGMPSQQWAMTTAAVLAERTSAFDPKQEFRPEFVQNGFISALNPGFPGYPIDSSDCSSGHHLSSTTEKELARSAMGSCDKSMGLLLGSLVSVGTLRDIATLVRPDEGENSPDLMPGTCCMDTSTTSQFFGVEYNPMNINPQTNMPMVCKNSGPWHLGISKEACAAAGGDWFRSPCKALKECIDDRPSRFNLDSPQEASGVHTGYALAPTDRVNFSDTNHGCLEFCGSLPSVSSQVGLVTWKNASANVNSSSVDGCICLFSEGHVPSIDVLGKDVFRSPPEFYIIDRRGAALGLAENSNCSAGELSVEVQELVEDNLRQLFRLSLYGSIISVLCPDHKLAPDAGNCSEGTILKAVPSKFTEIFPNHTKWNFKADGTISNVGCHGSMAMSGIKDDATLNSIYFSLENPRSHLVMGVSGADCQDEMDIELQEQVPGSPKQQFKRDGNKIASVMCPNSYVEVPDEDGCESSLRLSNDLATAGNTWIFHYDGTIESEKCNKYISIDQRELNSVSSLLSAAPSTSLTPSTSTAPSASSSPSSPLHDPPKYSSGSSSQMQSAQVILPVAGSKLHLMDLVGNRRYQIWTQQHRRFQTLEGPYSLVNSDSGTAISVGSNDDSCGQGMGLTALTDLHSDDSQQFYFGKLGAIFSLRCRGMAIAIDGCNNQTIVQLSTYMIRDNKMKWVLDKDRAIESLQCPGMVIGIENGSNALVLRKRSDQGPMQAWQRQNIRLLQNSSGNWEEDWSVEYRTPYYNETYLQEIGKKFGVEGDVDIAARLVDNEDVETTHYPPNPAFSTSFEDFAKGLVINDASNEDQCKKVRQELGFDEDHPFDTEVCRKFKDHMCDSFFSGVDAQAEQLARAPEFEFVEFKGVEFNEAGYEAPEYAADPDLGDPDLKPHPAWTIKGLLPDEMAAALKKLQTRRINSERALKTAELIEDFTYKFTDSECRALSETGAFFLAIICEISVGIELAIGKVILIAALIINDSFSTSYERSTLDPDLEINGYHYSEAIYKNMVEVTKWQYESFQATNENIKNQHMAMRQQLQDRHLAMENNLGRDIVDAQNANGELIVNAQNSNGQLIVDAQNEITRQHNVLGEWLHSNLALIYKAVGGMSEAFIGPLEEGQEFVPMNFHWPEGQPTLMERLHGVEGKIQSMITIDGPTNDSDGTRNDLGGSELKVGSVDINNAIEDKVNVSQGEMEELRAEVKEMKDMLMQLIKKQ